MDRKPPLVRGDLMLALDIIEPEFQKELTRFKCTVKHPTKTQCLVMKTHLINHLYGKLINWSCCCKDIENLKFLPTIISKGKRATNRLLNKQLKKIVIKC